MGAFDGDIATAQELIAEFGEDAIVRRQMPGAPDPTAPWKPVAAVPVDIPVRAVFLNYNLQSSGELYVGGSLIKATDKKVLVAAASAPDITVSDQIVRASGEVWKIANLYLLDPNGQRILYTLQAER